MTDLLLSILFTQTQTGHRYREQLEISFPLESFIYHVRHLVFDCPVYFIMLCVVCVYSIFFATLIGITFSLSLATWAEVEVYISFMYMIV